MNAPQAITVTLNPAIDQLVTLDALLPGQVQRALGSVQAPGGKGINVAAALAGLGVSTAALGVLGRDNAGMFEALFAQRGIADACLRVPGQTRTNIKLVADGGRQTTDINLPGLALAEAHLDAVMSTLARYLRPGLAVVLSGSLPAGLPADSWARLQAQAVAAGADVLLDTSEAPLAAALATAPHAAMPWAIKPNREELQAATGQRLDGRDALLAAARSLLDRGLGLAVVSMGEEGALFASAQGAVIARPPQRARGSSVGAGDAMVAGMVAARLRGLDLADTARLSTASALAWLQAAPAREVDANRVQALAASVLLEPCQWP